MADRGDTADRLARSSLDILRCCPTQRGHTEQGGAPFGIYPVCSARHQERVSVSVEDEAVGYRPDVNTEVVGRPGSGGDAFGEHVNLTLDTKSGEGVSDILSASMHLGRMTLVQRDYLSYFESDERPHVHATFSTVYGNRESFEGRLYGLMSLASVMGPPVRQCDGTGLGVWSGPAMRCWRLVFWAVNSVGG